MATYNRADLIENAINSVIDQSFKDWELLILDDMSSDNTENVIKTFLTDSRIKYIKNDKNLGVSKNRNKGLKIALGKYIAILDSDDVWTDREKLQKQYSLLEQNPEIGLVGTFMIKKYLDNKKEKITYETDDNKIRNKMLFRNQFTHSSVLYKKNLVPDGYNESLKLAEDYDLFLRIGLISKFSNIPDHSVEYLMSPNGESLKNKFKMATIVDKIISQYKKNYPHYHLASVKSAIRMIKALF